MKHFDIIGNVVILDIPVDNTWQLWYFIDHKFKSRDIWEISPAVKGMPGESIQGTYKANKNVC